MRILFLIAGLILASIPVQLFATLDAEAAYSPRGKCRGAIRTWRRKPGYGAFAISRSGNACGYSSGYPGRKAANRAAMRQCRKLRRRCRIISTVKGTGSRGGARLRGACLRNYNKWKRRDGYRAFALARNGTFCNAVWRAASKEAAEKQALAGCKSKSGCTIYRTGEPRDIKEVRQRQLKDLGFYSGKIDGSWGRGSRSALRRFVKTAGLRKASDATAFDLLKWAVRIKGGYDVENEVAVKNANRAMVSNSIVFMGEIAKAKPSQPTTIVGQSTIPSVEDTINRLGLRPKDKWIFGDGKWLFSKTDRNDPKAAYIGRCRLSSGGLVFAHYADPSIGSVAFFEAPKFSAKTKKATWVFEDNSLAENDVESAPGIPAYMKLKKAPRFFNAIAEDKILSVRSADGSQTIDISKIGEMAEQFSTCSRAVLLEPPLSNTAAPSSSISGVETDGGGVGETQQDKSPEFVVKRGRLGQFVLLAELDAEPVRVMVDTGATYVTVSESLARKIGIKVRNKDFKHTANTANGKVKFAKAVARELRVGGIKMRNVEIAVLRDKSLIGNALLGMSFLNRLKQFEFKGDRLRLVQ